LSCILWEEKVQRGRGIKAQSGRIDSISRILDRFLSRFVSFQMKLAQNNPPIGGSKTKTFSPNSYALFQNFPHKRVLSNEIFWPKRKMRDITAKSIF